MSLGGLYMEGLIFGNLRYVFAKFIFTLVCFWNDKKIAMLIVSLKQKKMTFTPDIKSDCK